MALPNDYSGQICSMSRTLEIVGERWTLLIVRDAFFGIRRFGDFVSELDIPRAVLTDRLKTLVAAGILAREATGGRREEYVLTEKGVALWPVLRAMTAWGDAYCAPDGPIRDFRHTLDGGLLDAAGRCDICGETPTVDDIMMEPGSGLDALADVPEARRVTLRLLEPVRG